MRLLQASIATTAGVWGAFYLHPSPPPGQYDFWDKIIIAEIAGVFTFAVAVMLASRTEWTFRGIGLLLSSFGLAVLFLLANVMAYVGVTRGYIPPETMLPHSRLDPGIREAVQDLGRATLGVGGLLLLIGLIFWTIGRFGRVAYLDDFMETGEFHAAYHPGRRADDEGPIWIGGDS